MEHETAISANPRLRRSKGRRARPALWGHALAALLLGIGAAAGQSRAAEPGLFPGNEASPPMRFMEQGKPLPLLQADPRLIMGIVVLLLAALVSGALLVREVRRRRRVEAALREVTDRHELVLAGAGGGIWDWDVSGHRVAYSARWKEIRGFAEDEITDAEAEWSSRVHPDDAPRVMAAVEAHFQGETPIFAEEYRVRHKDGSWIWVADRGIARRDAGGAVVRMAGSEIDITASKEAEENLRREQQRLRSILFAANVGTWEWNVQSGEVVFNERWAETLGYTLEELAPVSIQTWQRLAHPDDLKKSGALLEQHFQGELDHYECEARMRHKNGDWVWVMDRGRVISWTADGQPLLMRGTHTDITARKQAEAALRQSREDLDRAQAVGQIGWWRLDTRRNELTWSEENHRIFGAPAGTTLSYEAFLAIIHPDDREYVDARWQAALRGEPYDIEHRIIADGQIKWVREKAYLEFDAAGALLGGFGITQDITARKRAEAELERTRDMLAEGQRIAHLGSWEYDAVTQTTIWSDEEKRIYGLDPARPSPDYQTLLRQHIHPDDAADLDRLFRAAMADRAPFENENRIVRPDGSVRWTYNQAQPYFDEHGNLLRYVGATLDITQRKQLQESEQRLLEFMDHNPSLLFLKDAAGRYVYMNRAYQEQFVPGGDWQGKTDGDFWPEQSAALFRANDAEVLASGTARQFLEDSVDRDGKRRCWLCYKFCFIDAGGAKYVGGIGIDATKHIEAEEALARSEQRLAALMRAVPVGVSFSSDPTCREITGNPAVLAQFAIRPEDNLSASAPDPDAPGRKVRFFHQGREISDSELPVQQAVAQNREIPPMELEVVMPDGRRWIALASGAPVRDEKGNVLAGLAVTVDITARKQAEEALQAATLAAERARAIAESASRAKDQFIAVLSHELRTPLAPVTAAVAMLRKDPRLPEDALQDLATIAANLELEVRLIEDLLDVSRAVSGKMNLHLRPVDAVQVVRDAAAVVAGEFSARGQTLEIDTAGAPWLLRADPARLQQVFWNLLRNAGKFSPPQAHITVRGRVEPVSSCPLVGPTCPIERAPCPLAPDACGQPAAQNLLVEVIDPGCGIAPEHLPHLFEPFAQEQRSRVFGGLGLGLAICKAVVELHGGTISARSDGPGRGAIFTVRLPVAQCPLDAVLVPEAAGLSRPTPLRKAGSNGAGGSGGLRIVLVEDHGDTARLMQRLLTRYGHQVTLASGVAEGVDAVCRTSPDLLISDLGLGDGSGLDLMRLLVERGHVLPAIALSGYGQEEDRRQSLDAGFILHLVKPVDSDALARAIADTAARR